MADTATPEQLMALKGKLRNWINAKFGGDWDRAFRYTANRNNTDHTINHEGLLFALEQAGIGNWITRGEWAGGLITALDQSADHKISVREFNRLFRLEETPRRLVKRRRR